MRNFNRLTLKQILLFGLLTAFVTSGLFIATATAGKRPLAKVKQVRAQAQANGVLLQWQPVENADGYRIYHQSRGTANSNSMWFDVAGEQTTSLYSEVRPQTRYSFRVGALHGRDQGPLSAPTSLIWKNTRKNASDTAP